MRTHFYPYSADDDIEQAPCGARIGESSALSNQWAHVDCRLCIRNKAKITAAHKTNERAIVEQMGDMAEFMRAQTGEQS